MLKLAGSLTASQLRWALPVITMYSHTFGSFCARAWLSPALLLATSLTGYAQPSGGPYGPRSLTYEIPSQAPHVFYVAPDGRAEVTGSVLDQPTTLESAIARANTGDAVVLRGGTYRVGGLQLNQGITLQPFQDEQPVLKGTDVADNWESLRGGVWRTRWKTLFPCGPRPWWRREREGMLTPLHRFNNDMVFVDGRALQSAGWEGELDENTYSIDYERGYVYIKQDPKGHLMEITARDSALVCTGKPVKGKAADHKGPIIRGITFTQYAYRALEVEGKRGSVSPMEEPTDDPIGLADPSTFGKEVIGTVLEDCTVTHCSRVAGYFRGDRLVIRNCLVSDTSTEGIYVIGSSDCLLERNIFMRNNVEHLTGYYPAAVKIFNQTRRVVFRDNLITDNPDSNGVWYDVGNVDGVFVDNWVEGCDAGLFFEISQGLVCAGNVFANCRQGVRILNSRGAHILHNTFVNAAVYIGRNERSAKAGDHFGWHITTGPDVGERSGQIVAGNILAADPTYAGPLLTLDQSPALRGILTSPQVARLDDNLYIRAARAGQPALIAWAPATTEHYQMDFQSLAEFQKTFPAFEPHGEYFAIGLASALQSPALKRFALAKPLGQSRPAADNLPRLLGWPPRDAYVPGAYQILP